jgi:hypothetical protein
MRNRQRCPLVAVGPPTAPMYQSGRTGHQGALCGWRAAPFERRVLGMSKRTPAPPPSIAELAARVLPPAALAAAESDLADLRARETDLRARLSVASQHVRSPIAGSQMRLQVQEMTSGRGRGGACGARSCSAIRPPADGTAQSEAGENSRRGRSRPRPRPRNRTRRLDSQSKRFRQADNDRR